MKSIRSSIITLLTDFGLDDFFVGAMKGVILNINPTAKIIDITHTIKPQDIRSAAFSLAESCGEFPEGTVHVAVVDPGVGSTRKPILVVAENHLFVGPDNGIFSFIYNDKNVENVIHITNDQYFRKPVSNTFHGRDIFSPVAAWISSGLDPVKLGPPISDFVTFNILKPDLHSSKSTGLDPAEAVMVQGHVIHIDRFGNLITNLTSTELPSEKIQAGIQIIVNGRKISQVQSHFAGAPPGKVFAVFGSTGRLEIAVNQGSAEKVLEASADTLVEVVQLKGGNTD